MRSNPEISNIAGIYLSRYYEILDKMISGMTEAELTDSISHNFIVQMIPHHQAAIEMSENILQYTTCLPLQRIARNIVREQQESIQNMRAILEQCGERINSAQELERYQLCVQGITGTMFSRMGSAAADNCINADFMREMIPHHQGAIQMSRNALAFPICQDLRPILRAIIRSQTQGVREMETLLRCG